ncbi:MAG: hypothetical protein ABRQ39_30875 [Candidatus Eremiobacterota bacterium]
MFSIFFMISSFFLEGFSLYLLFCNYIDREVYIITGHIMASVLASLSVYLLKDKRTPFYPFVFIFLLSLPAFGYIGIYQMLQDKNKGQTVNLYEEYREYILSGTRDRDKTPKLTKSLDFLKLNIDLQPFRDSVRIEEDFSQKLNLVKSLGKLVSHNSIEILKDLLHDPHMDIRYYAGEELARISEKYNLFINELKLELKEHPSDYRTYLDLGSVIMEYAFSGLFDNYKTVKEELKNAKSALSKSLELNSDQYEANFLMGRIYLYERDYDKAINHIKKSLSSKEHDMSSLTAISECYWQKKDLKNMNIYIKKIEPLVESYEGDEKEKIKDFIVYWRGVGFVTGDR